MSVNIYNSNPNATSEEENFSLVADRGSKLASDTIYSNTTSGLNSVNVQGAIDEVNEKVDDNVEAISQINSDLTESSTTSTTNSVMPFSVNNVNRSGNSVNMFLLGITSSPVSVSPTTVVATIPEGYRPKSSTYVFGFQAPTSGGTQTHTIFRIDTNGNIYYNGGSTTKNMGYILIVGSYGC